MIVRLENFLGRSVRVHHPKEILGIADVQTLSLMVRAARQSRKNSQFHNRCSLTLQVKHISLSNLQVVYLNIWLFSTLWELSYVVR